MCTYIYAYVHIYAASMCAGTELVAGIWRWRAGGTSDPPAGNPTSRPSSKGSRGNVTSPHNTQLEHTGRRNLDKTQDRKHGIRNGEHRKCSAQQISLLNRNYFVLNTIYS